MARTDDTPKTSIPTNDAWTGMLAVSLAALVLGSVFLFMDWMQYSKKPDPVVKMPSSVIQDQSPAPAPADGQPPDDKGGKDAPDGAKKDADGGAKKDG
jgi:hypothetical protein